MSRSQPAIVAIGGGHGLAISLEASASWTDDVTAVVSVADDGGSSGRIRSQLGLPAPGDMRRCLEALTPPGPARAALGHRFAAGDLAGHPAGNVLLAALLEVSAGPVEAVDALAAMVGARGRVLPATLDAVELVAHTAHGAVRGQVAVSESPAVDAVATEPADPRIPHEVEAAIGRADLLVLGPGSLFTSVLAALVPAVGRAIEAAPAPLVYVANLTTQAGETAGMTLADHVAAVRRHGVTPNVVLVDETMVDDVTDPDVRVVRAAVAAREGLRHDAVALGRAISELVPTARA